MAGEEQQSQMPTEIGADAGTRQLAAEIERHRASSAHLLDSFAQKLGATAARGSRGANDAVRSAASNVQRAAHYVQDNYVKSMATEVGRFIRRRPASSLAIAAAAGYFIGRTLRSR